MPDFSTMTTEEVLAEMDQYPLSQGLADIKTELELRIIKSGDADCNTQTGDYETQRGIRPYRSPRVI